MVVKGTDGGETTNIYPTQHSQQTSHSRQSTFNNAQTKGPGVRNVEVIFYDANLSASDNFHLLAQAAGTIAQHILAKLGGLFLEIPHTKLSFKTVSKMDENAPASQPKLAKGEAEVDEVEQFFKSSTSSGLESELPSLGTRAEKNRYLESSVLNNVMRMEGYTFGNDAKVMLTEYKKAVLEGKGDEFKEKMKLMRDPLKHICSLLVSEADKVGLPNSWIEEVGKQKPSSPVSKSTVDEPKLSADEKKFKELENLIAKKESAILSKFIKKPGYEEALNIIKRDHFTWSSYAGIEISDDKLKAIQSDPVKYEIYTNLLLEIHNNNLVDLWKRRDELRIDLMPSTPSKTNNL